MELPRRRFVTHGLIPSPITGRGGNHEYLLWLTLAQATPDPGATHAIERGTMEGVVEGIVEGDAGDAGPGDEAIGAVVDEAFRPAAE